MLLRLPPGIGEENAVEPRTPSKAERQEIIREVQRIAREDGTPSVSRAEFRERSDVRESAVVKHFRTHNGLLQAAGLQVRSSGTKPYSEEHLVEELVRVLTLPGADPTRNYFKTHGKVSASLCEKRFGGWRGALSKAVEHMDPSEHDVERIRRHIDRFGSLTEASKPSERLASTREGSDDVPGGSKARYYRKFLQAAGVRISDVVRAVFSKLRTGQLPEEEESPSPFDHAPEGSIEDILGAGETDRVEFKSSAYYSYKRDVPERVITESVLKTVAGFLNADGGTLLVGIADDGEILGIQPDLAMKNMDGDRYVNSLTTAIERSLGSLASTMAKIRLQSIDGLQVAVLQVARSPEPIYAKVSKGGRAFFVRVNNSTRRFDEAAVVSYVNQHWA